MKKLIVTLTIAACSAAFTIQAEEEKSRQPETRAAERPGTGRFNPEERIKRLNEALSLTQDQQDKIKKIWAEGRPQFESARALPQEERREKIREVAKAEHEKVMDVLTPAQKEKFREMVARRAEGFRGEGEEETPKSEERK